MKRRRLGLRIAAHMGCMGVGILIVDLAMIFHLRWASFYILGLLVTWGLSTQVTRLR